MIIYLNENWKTGDDNELKIYCPNVENNPIKPLSKLLAMVKNNTVEHQVMVTDTHRKSLTRWLLHKSKNVRSIIKSGSELDSNTK